METLGAIFLHSPLFDRVSDPARGGLKNAKAVVTLCSELGILPLEELRTVPQASRKELELFHTERYVQSVLNGPPNHGTDLVTLAQTLAGGSLMGATLLAENKANLVFFPAGGDTHARPDAPSRMDLFNDAALAVSLLASLGMRVAFINFSARHAESVQAAFYERPDILTVSLHEASKDNIPSSGFVGEDGMGDGKGSALNVPLSEGIFDEAVLEILSDIVIPFVRRKQPDALVAVLSPDILASDQTTSSALTNNILVETVRSLTLLHRPLLVLGGDGHNEESAVRTWALTWAALTKRISLANANSGSHIMEHPAFVPPQRRLEVGKEMKSILDVLRKRLYGTRLPTRKDLKAIEELDQE